jgi:putative ABC transport system permease protein
VAGTYNAKGVYPAYFNIERQHLHFGRLINEIDHLERRKVCLIGSRVCEELFKNADPCGKYIRVNGLYYQIVGVVEQIATNVNIGGRAESTVFLPFSTMQQTLNQGDILHFLCVSVFPGYPIERVIDDVKDLLKRQNEISPTDPQAVVVLNIAAQFSMFEKLFTGIDTLVWLVGLGTLLAGIIGISNIMMVTVKERTREIGIRRAIGAKPWNIISQVMSESLLLTAMAGMLGLSLGVFVLDFADKLLTAQASKDFIIVHPSVKIGTAIAATFVLLICGLLAGLIPAWRALQIKAIDAIREE